MPDPPNTAVATRYFGTLDKYDPEECWTNYSERVEQFFIINEIEDDKKKVAIFLSSAGAKVYGLLKNLLSPVVPSTKTFAELSSILKAYYEPEPLVIAERFKLLKRDQKEGESTQEYYATIRELSKTCSYGNFLEEAVRDKFVCGLKDVKIQRRLLAETKLTAEKALKLATAWELAHLEQEPVRSAAVFKVEESSGKCFRCGKFNHHPGNCRFKNATCFGCQKSGHISRMCPAKTSDKSKKTSYKVRGKRASVHEVKEEETSEEEDFLESDLHWLGLVNNINSPMMVDMLVDGVSLNFELDTGAAVTIINKETWRKLGSPILSKVKMALRDYSGNKLPLMGQASVEVCYKGENFDLPIHVVANSGRLLLGRDWLAKLKFNWNTIENSCINMCTNERSVKNLVKKYDMLFDGKLGLIRDIKAHFQINQDNPKFFKHRPVPYAIKEKLGKELDRLEKLRVIEKINHSRWAAPIVPIVKANGELRLCGDFKVTVNSAIEVDQYPIPRVEDIFAALQGGEKFTTLDLSEAYLQLELADELKSSIVINTHKGLYKYNRLCFGINAAPAIFQKVMDMILKDLKGVSCYLDDVVITGKNENDHMENLEAVFEKFAKF